MIIAIDETGDFSPDSEKLSFFVAVLLDQYDNGIATKKEQFLNWLKTIPKEKFSDKNEVKGSKLYNEELLAFVKQVYNSDPVIRVEIGCLQPKENPEDLMLKFKEIEVKKIFRLSELAKDDDKDEMAKQYERMAIWHKNAKKMHYPHFFKLILLRSVIVHAFRTAVGVSILLEKLYDKDSKNLLNIEIKIDQDFVRGDDPTIYWKELLRTHFISHTRHTPIPASKEWTAEHPFLKKYASPKDGTLNFNDIFRNHTHFVESHEHFEIQIADIVGIIINRFYNGQQAVDAYNELWAKLKKSPITRIIMNPNLNDVNIEPEIIE
jgi:hypothetical protein